jgi:hypothetical protein
MVASMKLARQVALKAALKVALKAAELRPAMKAEQ